MTYIFWNIFNPFFVSPLYLILLVVADLRFLKQTPVRIWEVIAINFSALYAWIILVIFSDIRLDYSINWNNMIYHDTRTRIFNLTFVLLVLLKIVYYKFRIKKQGSIAKVAWFSLLVVILTAFVELYILTGYHPEI